MKKHLFLTLATVAMLASCSNDEVLNTVENMQPEQKAIGFNSFVNKSTRANSDISTLKSNGFWVFGFMAPTNTSATSVTSIFNNAAVTYSDNKWGYEGVRYWTKGNSYGFTAIYPNPNTNNYLTFTPTTTYNSDGNYTQGGEIKFNNSSTSNAEVDLIADFQNIGNVDPITQGMVNFTFNHYLSRIKFRFDNGFSNNTIQIKGLSLGSMDSEATCHTATSLSNVTWTLTNENTSFSKNFTFPSEDIPVGGNKVSSYYYAIPQTAKKHTASFTVELYTGSVLTGEYNFTNIELPAIDMKPGYSYQYHAKIDASNINGGNELKPIEFGVTQVNGWQTDKDVDMFLLGISKKNVTLNVNATLNLAPYITTADPLTLGTDYSVSYAYSSDNTSVATVSDAGLITAKATGTANVTCTATVTVLKETEPYVKNSTVTISQTCVVTVP